MKRASIILNTNKDGQNASSILPLKNNFVRMKEKLIFVIDEDKTIRNLLEYTLISKEGCMVKVFSNAEECLKNLHLKPDYIILDQNFSKKGTSLVSGLALLSEIKNREQAIQVIVLSDTTNKQFMKRCFSEGASDFISKDGYFIDQLLDKLN